MFMTLRLSLYNLLTSSQRYILARVYRLSAQDVEVGLRVEGLGRGGNTTQLRR